MNKHPGMSPIKLGLMPPLTGLVSIYGAEISRAGRIACDEINAANGVLGRPLEIVIKDDGSQPTTSVPAAHSLVDAGCVAIIGNLLSNSRIAVASQVAEPRKTPYLNFSFYEGSIWGRYFFNFAALPNQQIDKMIPYMIENFGPKVYFAGSNYEWPRGSIDAAKQSVVAANGEVVGEQYLPFDTVDFRNLLRNLKKSGANVFVPYFAGTDQINLLNQFTKSGLKEQMAVVMGHYDEAMVSSLKPHVREGFYSSNTYFMSIENEKNRQYLKALAEQPDVEGIWPTGNGVVTNFGEGAYLSVMAFAQAAEQSQSLDPNDLVEALSDVEVHSLQGVVKMDSRTHHASVNTYLARCTPEGTFPIIEKFGQIEPKMPARYTINEFIDLSDTTPAESESDAVLFKPSEYTQARILEYLDVPVLSSDEYGRIVQANVGATKMFGYDKSELIGMNISELMPPRFRTRHKRLMREFIDSGMTSLNMSGRSDIRAYKKDGAEVLLEVTLARLRDKNGWIIAVIMRDISERIVYEENLIKQATHDELTGLPNRNLITDRLDNALARARRSTQNVGILFIDLDNFKLINDSHGHDVGDEVLISISERLVEAVRPGDTVARLGGDEFIVLCDQLNNEADIAQIAERIIDNLNTPIKLGEIELFATASIGAVIGDKDRSTSENLLGDADAAMYSAKESGRNKWQIYNKRLRDSSRNQLDLSNKIRSAIEREELELHFQPIVCVNSQAIKGAEALLRWTQDGKSISPATFIPIAELTGTINEIGQWVFDQSCQAMSNMKKTMGDSAPYLSVNLSPKQLQNKNLLDGFQKSLSVHGLDPENFILEITETAIVENIDYNNQLLDELTRMGFNLAIDDFGTGYSSLGQLMNLRVNHLKIDKVFIDNISAKRGSRQLVEAIITMAHAMEFEIIAEGVENQDQLAFLNEMGCQKAQGYLFSPAVPYDRFLALV